MPNTNHLESNLSKIKPAFRTKGSFAGNFGSGRRTGGSKYNEALVSDREHVGNFPTKAEYRERLQAALVIAKDPKLVEFIKGELHHLDQQEKPSQWRNPEGPYCSLENYYITAAQ